QIHYIASFEFIVHSGLCSFYHLQICSSAMLMAETPRAPSYILKLFGFSLYPFVFQSRFKYIFP
ncbi:hypothetical protein LCE44_28275, partial [Vibrio harveyi]